MPAVTTNLRMVFSNEMGRQTAISMFDPDPALTEESVEAVMDFIIEKDFFDTTGGALTGKVRAEIVERSVENLFTA